MTIQNLARPPPKGDYTMFEVNIVTGVGKKTNRPYTALEIVFPNGYKKLVFLDGAEAFLVNNN